MSTFYLKCSFSTVHLSLLNILFSNVLASLVVQEIWSQYVRIAHNISVHIEIKMLCKILDLNMCQIKQTQSLVLHNYNNFVEC